MLWTIKEGVESFSDLKRELAKNVTNVPDCESMPRNKSRLSLAFARIQGESFQTLMGPHRLPNASLHGESRSTFYGVVRPCLTPLMTPRPGSAGNAGWVCPWDLLSDAQGVGPT